MFSNVYSRPYINPSFSGTLVWIAPAIKPSDIGSSPLTHKARIQETQRNQKASKHPTHMQAAAQYTAENHKHSKFEAFLTFLGKITLPCPPFGAYVARIAFRESLYPVI